MHPSALSCPLGQVVRPVFTGTFESMRRHGYFKELEPGRLLVRISITDPLTGKRSQPSKTIRGTKKDAELALVRLQMGPLCGTTASTDPTLNVVVDQVLPTPTRSSSRQGREAVTGS